MHQDVLDVGEWSLYETFWQFDRAYISCDGRMLDDAEILVVSEFEPEIIERVVELFG